MRDADLSVIGSVDIKAGGAGSDIFISNFDGSGAQLALVQLTSAGEIRFQPAGGQKVVIAGPLDAEQITYLPQGSTVKATL